MKPMKPRIVAEAARELADIADRIGLFGASAKLREYGAAIDHGSDAGDNAAAAVLQAKVAYDQSATKRVVDALAEVGRFLNARRSPLRRVGRAGRRAEKSPEIAKPRAAG